MYLRNSNLCVGTEPESYVQSNIRFNYSRYTPCLPKCHTCKARISKILERLLHGSTAINTCFSNLKPWTQDLSLTCNRKNERNKKQRLKHNKSTLISSKLNSGQSEQQSKNLRNFDQKYAFRPESNLELFQVEIKKHLYFLRSLVRIFGL